MQERYEGPKKTRHFFLQFIERFPSSVHSLNFNFCAQDGGAIRAQYSSSIDIEDCTFESNQAVWWNGGSIYTETSTARIASSRFISCYATRHGGALTGTGYALVDVLFDSNQAVEEGGALGAFSGSCVACNFTSNRAKRGGAISTFGDVLIERSVFTDCVATELGAAVYSQNQVKISDSLVHGFKGVYSGCDAPGIARNSCTGFTVVDSTSCAEFYEEVYFDPSEDDEGGERYFTSTMCCLLGSSAMCCGCGGGSWETMGASEAPVFYHASDSSVLELARIEFSGNNVTSIIDSEHEATVMLYNSRGLFEADANEASLIGCSNANIYEYCFDDQRVDCTDTSTGIEVRVQMSGAM